MAGWDWREMDKENKARLAKMLPVSIIPNDWSDRYKRYVEFDEGKILTVGEIDVAVQHNQAIVWYYGGGVALRAAYEDCDREHYPSGRVVIMESRVDGTAFADSDIAKAVQLLFDMIYPRRA